MLSKNKIKIFSSLSEKKSRMETMLFLVEGEKMVLELLDSGFTVQALLFTEKMKSQIISHPIRHQIETFEISENEASKISTQKTPQGIFATAIIPPDFYSRAISLHEGIILALHDIQDPGNLGTIIRTADWFGVKQIMCSKSTVDIFNPKVLQSTMGAAFRVKMVYTELKESIQSLKTTIPDLPIFAAILDGENLYKTAFPSKGIIMMGNESKGLSPDLIQLASHKITIPRFGNSPASSESLNVSVATAIILSELQRRTS